jgi:glycosyltransferase involved in cell wall biosynthesis
LPKRTQIPAVATFHDLFVMTAEYSSPDFRQRFEAQARHAAAHAHHIIAVSQFTADQVADLLSYPRDRMTVVPHGVSNEPNVPPIESRQPIVLTVGAVQKRKNTARLIEAFTAMPAPWELWIAGSLGFEAEAVLESAKTNPRIRLLGYVADTELRELYRRAAIFAFPSLDEGFGMPVLEAMSYGVPVLTSNRSSLPEVAGDAAVLVDPFSVDSIAEGLRSLQEESSRHTWTERGLRRAREFTWERAARETAAVYESVLGVQFGTASYPEA